jgi:hypothetical protein
MAESKKKDPKNMDDVAQPGKTPPSPNSKSVIITHGPIMKDPMVVVEEAETNESDTTVEAPASEKTSTSRTAPLLEPVSDKMAAKTEKSAKTKPTEPEPEPEDHEKIEVKITPKTETPTPEPAPEETVPEIETKPEEPDTEEEPATDQPKADETATPAEVDDAAKAAATEDAEKEAGVQKLIDGKQYFLPINTVEKRKSKRFVALGIVLSLLLAVAWADIALDAGLIDIQGVKPVTHFFSN